MANEKKDEKRTYLVVHPKLAITVKLKGQDKARLQNVPVGVEVERSVLSAKHLVASGKLTLVLNDKELKALEKESQE